jgi:hypothetical protein
LARFFLDVIEVVVFAIGIFFFVYLLIMRPHKIKGQSMHPTFPDKEYLLTEKVSYYLHKPERGDVIVFQPPISENDEFIKRIIGLPGPRPPPLLANWDTSTRRKIKSGKRRNYFLWRICRMMSWAQGFIIFT